MNSTTKKVAEIAFIVSLILAPLTAVTFIYTMIHGGMFAAQPFGGAMFFDAISVFALSWVSQGRV